MKVKHVTSVILEFAAEFIFTNDDDVQNLNIFLYQCQRISIEGQMQKSVVLIVISFLSVKEGKDQSPELQSKWSCL